MSALPRRPFLGIRVRPVDPAGLQVTAVIEGATAASSGVRIGDVIEGVDSDAVADANALTRLLRGERGATLAVRRGGTRIRLPVQPVPFPAEAHPHADVTYAQLEVAVNGAPARWRMLVSTPRVDTRWAILFLGGIHVDSLERLGAPTPLDHVLSELARVAVTVRVERGVGDSEGPGPAHIDFETEARAYRSAIESLREAGQSVALLGHSIGGMHAPLLPADARVVYGTSAARWSTCLAESTRRQLRLRDPATETEDAELRARRFDTDALRERPPSFHAQLEALDLDAAWRACPEPTLVLHGEFDWVVGRRESEEVATIAANAEHVEVPGADHAFACHGSLEESLRDYGRGAPASEVVTQVCSFLDRASDPEP